MNSKLIIGMLVLFIINTGMNFYFFFQGSIAFQSFVKKTVPQEQAFVLLGNCEYLIEKHNLNDKPENCVAETYLRAEAFEKAAQK